MTTNFFQGARLKKNLGRFYCVDFTGHPSNQFSGYRLNGGFTYFQQAVCVLKSNIVCNPEIMVATKIYKKCSPHGRLYLYLGQRDFISSDGLIEDIKGIAYTPELSEIQGEKFSAVKPQ